MREFTQEVPKYAEMCRRFLADEADFAKENIDRCEITVSYENVDLESCYRAICDRICE